MFGFGLWLSLLRLLFFSLSFFELAFHLVLSLVRATIRVVVLVVCSNVPVIGFARPFSYIGYKPVASTISVSSVSLVLRRAVIVATVGRETVVFRLLPSSGRAYHVFHNRSQHCRDVISLTLLFALRSPWKGPLELSLFSVTLSLALRINRLKVCPLFLVFCLGCT